MQNKEPRPPGAVSADITNLLDQILPANKFYARKLDAVSSLDDLFTLKQELIDDLAANPPYGTNLTFPLGHDELSFWSPQTKTWVVEPEKFDVWAGEDSTAPLHAEFQITAQ